MGLKWRGKDECGQQTFCNKEKKEFLLSCNLLVRLPKAPWNPLPPGHLFRLATRCQAFIADLNSFALRLMQASFLSVNVRYPKMISPSQFQPTTWELDFEYENKVIRFSRFKRACAASGGNIPISVYSWLSFIFMISLHLWYTPATISFNKTDMRLFPKIWLHFK